jgi:hypothetical protein
MWTDWSRDAEHYPDYSVRVVRIERRADHLTQRHGNRSGTTVEGSLTALAFGPLTWVALTGCSFSIIILALAIKKRDGMAFLADIFLSFLSSLVGIACKWTLKLPKRLNWNDFDPPGDVVIRYLKGSFLVVQCDEDVARELYFAPENIEYLVKQPWQYRIISLAGTMLLMFGVIFLGNATTLLQTYIAGAYIILNAIYWIVAALPNRVHWDTSCFVVTDQYIENPNEIIEKSFTSNNKSQCVDFNLTFTNALWKAILVTKEVDWIRRSAAAPDTAAWREWLYQAKQEAGKASYHSVLVDGREVKVWKNPGWDAHQALSTCMENNKSDPEKADDVARRATLAEAQDTICDADVRQTED